MRTRWLHSTAALLVAAAAISMAGCENMPWNKDKTSDTSKTTDKSRANDNMVNKQTRNTGEAAGAQDMSNKMMKRAVADVRPSQAATTQPTLNNVTGTVTFTQTGPDMVTVNVDLRGLTPNTKHGFHIHEKGDLSSADLSSAGNHFNPGGHKHGGPESPMAHAGDLGNVTADASGNVRADLTARGITLEPGKDNSIVGKSVLVHAKEDDLKTDPSGNSGGRVAGGVIQAQ